MTTKQPTLDIVSVGQSCQILQQHPGRIKDAAAALGIVPAARINMVDHYSATQLEQIRQHLQGGLLETPQPTV